MLQQFFSSCGDNVSHVKLRWLESFSQLSQEVEHCTHVFFARQEFMDQRSKDICQG